MEYLLVLLLGVLGFTVQKIIIAQHGASELANFKQIRGNCTATGSFCSQIKF